MSVPARLVAQQGAGFREGRPKPFRTVDQPAFTVHGGSKSGEGGGVRHRWECPDGTSRPLSLPEYGSLQSFPCDYPWQGPVSSARLQAGNAVPPLLALAVLSVASGAPVTTANRPLIADDLFAGAGGWDLAAEALGIHARGVENMTEARATRDAAGLTTIHDDVWTFTPDGAARGLIASPPCQTFSAAGKGSGRKALDDVLAVIASGDWNSLVKLKEAGLRFGDDRTALVLTPLHFATGYEYEWLAWEQVPAVLPVWEACAEVLRELGWNVWTGLLQAEMYGVPQTRKRAFLLASRLGPVAPPTPTHSRYYSRSPEKLDEGVQKWVSMAEALGWVADGQARNSGPAAARTPRAIEEPSYTIRAQGSGSHPSGVEWVMRSNYGTGGDASNRGERSASEPAPTVTSKIDRNKWVVVTGQDSRVSAAEVQRFARDAEHPAPTVTGTTDRWKVGPDWPLRRPAPTPAIEGETPGDCEWVTDRPSPTVVGTYAPDVVAKPGYRKAGDPPRQKTPGSVRVTVQEAGVLQSFPADYPWQGAKGKQYLQCGNAVPPLLAWHALGAAAVHHLAGQEAVA